MNTKILNNTVHTSILVQVITGIVGLIALLKNTSPEHNILKNSLSVEMFVQLIQFLFYIFFIRLLTVKDMAKNRYYDWFITTPLMLITSIAYYKYEEYIEKFEQTKDVDDIKNLKELNLVNFIKDNKDDIIKIVFFNFLMLLFGYLGEIGVISKTAGFVLGFVFFIMAFNIMNKYAKKSKKGMVLYKILFIVWSIYGFAYLADPLYKNIIFNGLDIIAKNFFGVYLSVKIFNAKPITS